MKTMVLTLALAAAAASASAQPAPAAGGPPVAPAVIREPPSNIQLNVDVDRFIGYASQSPVRISRETIMTRAILTPGDPSVPGPNGATLRYRKQVVLGMMQPGEATPISTMPEQQVIYIQSGQARIDDGTSFWDVKPGFTVLIPPNQGHRFTNTGEDQLSMIMMESLPKAGLAAVPGIVVRDANKMMYIEQGAHWNNLSKAPFADLGERFLLVYLAPMSIAGPHAHTPETDEGWVKFTDGPTLMQLGSELRSWPINAGIIAPNNGQTVHAAINNSNRIQGWFYFASTGPTAPLTPAQAAALPGNNPPRANPAILQATLASTVAGRPLNPPAPRR
jgi:mannose-6-phosphate isomerase-like protein (cupin superfamily)